MIKNQNGITLISLIITIIVMLIIAGVAISMAVGEGSVIEQAGNARKESNMGKYKEEIELISLAENTKFRLKEVTFDEEVNSIEASILAKDYVTDVTRKQYSDGIILEVTTNEDIISVDCRENGIGVTEGIRENIEEVKSIFNYVINEDDKVEIIGFNFDVLEYEEHPEEMEVLYTYGPGITVKNMSTLNIPSQIDGKDVVKVDFSNYASVTDWGGSRELAYIKGINKIVFPSTVKEIGPCGCFIELTDVELNEGLEKLYHTFWGIPGLTKITIPSSVQYIIDAFRGNHTIEITVLGKSSSSDFLNFSEYWYYGLYDPNGTELKFIYVN